MPLDGTAQEEWLTREGELRARAGPEMYYVAVMDCDDDLHLLLGDNKHGRIQVSTHISDGHSEFSYEKQGILVTDALLVAVYATIMIVNLGSWRKYRERHALWNTPHIYCLAAMACQLISTSLDLTSNILFSRSGDEYLILDVLTSMTAMAGECTMILLLMMIANGWMTVWLDFDQDDAIEIYVPLFMLVILVHLVFGCLSFIDRNAYHKYHDFQGYVGVGLIIAKLLLVVVFYYFYHYNHQKVSKTQLEFYN